MKSKNDDVLYTIKGKDGLVIELYKWAGSVYARLLRGDFIKADSRCEGRPDGSYQEALKWAYQYQ